MSYAQLKAFHAVAMEGSIQKAAARLSLTQPAVSIHIKNLEKDSGKSLFRRNGHALALSSDGEVLFETTVRMLRAEDDAKMILSSPTRQYRGTLVVGADGPHVALDLIRSFHKQNPDIRVEVIFGNAETTWSNLLNLRVDVAVLAGSPPDPRTSKKTIAKQSLTALLPVSHELANRTEISLDQISDFPLIFRESGSSTQAKLDTAFLATGLAPNPAFVMGSREGVHEAVIRGMGIGFMFSNEVGKDPRITAVPITGFEHINIDELACLKHQRSSPYVDALFACAPDVSEETAS